MLVLLGFIFAVVTIAHYKQWLSISGSIAALIVGTLIALAFSWVGLFVLGAFFVSSSLLSKVKNDKDKQLDDESTRSANQVLANGGVAALFSLLYLLQPEFIWFAGFTASLAAATADTWASEMGRLFGGNPRHCLTFKLQPKGTSGAVSWLGSIAALTGSFFVTIIAYVTSGFDFSLSVFVVITAAGFLGQWVDTLLGAMVEVKYYCPVCGATSETKYHCKVRGRTHSGWRFMTNDVVNTSCTLSAAVAAILFLL